MAKRSTNEDATYVLDSKTALPNKLLQDDGTTTDIAGNVVVNPVEAYDNKPALPNKFLNPDGTYSTLNEIIASMVDTSIYVIVDELPAEGDPQKVYLVPDGQGGFVEYHWTGTKWDPIGMIEFDLSNYSTTQEMMNAIEASALQTLNASKTYTNNAVTNFMPVYEWDGVNSSTKASNLTLWQTIYNTSKTKKVGIIWQGGTESAYGYAILTPGSFHGYDQSEVITIYFMVPQMASATGNINGYANTQQVASVSLTRDLSTDTITSVDSVIYSSAAHVYQFLATNDDSQQPIVNFTPTKDMHPATKKYVDDSIATNITNVLGGEY